MDEAYGFESDGSEEELLNLLEKLDDDDDKSNNSRPVKTEPVVEQKAPTKILDQLKPFATAEVIKKTDTIYRDPIFGMRIVNPLMSSTMLATQLANKKTVTIANLQNYITNYDLSNDWVICAVLISKSNVKKTKRDDTFSIWKLSDLKGDMKQISLYLFRSGHDELWKTSVGTVILVLNAKPFERYGAKADEVNLSIDTAKKVLILGQSKDFGTCKSRKANGDPCTSLVNLSEVDVCIYHMKQAYSNLSRRSDIQSTTAGRGLNALRNKVLGKNEVFYQGQSFSAVPAKKSVALKARDDERLKSLSDYFKSPQQLASKAEKKSVTTISSKPIVKTAATLENAGTASQRQKDLKLLALLGGPVAKENTETIGNTVALNELKAPAQKISVEEFKSKSSLPGPLLSRDNFSFCVDLQPKKADLSKLKAMQILKNKPIQKSDPNQVRARGSGKRKLIEVESPVNAENTENKKAKLNEPTSVYEKYKDIIEAKSSHMNLVERFYDEEQEKYFNKMEKKEAIEEKMLNTFKVPCKAVICNKCKYTAFSASNRCKEEGHPIRVVDAVKRFFECEDCGNRTVSVFRLPQLECKNCKGKRWKRAAMIKDKMCKTVGQLSIRGDEEKFLNGFNGATNLDII